MRPFLFRSSTVHVLRLEYGSMPLVGSSDNQHAAGHGGACQRPWLVAPAPAKVVVLT